MATVIRKSTLLWTVPSDWISRLKERASSPEDSQTHSGLSVAVAVADVIEYRVTVLEVAFIWTAAIEGWPRSYGLNDPLSSTEAR